MLSYRIADFTHALRFDELPPQTVRMTRLAFLDWLGSALRGGSEEPARMALAVLQTQGGLPQATILPSGEKTSALNAALANGIGSHIVELDDVHRGAILHAGAVVIPAALAAAEMVHADGHRLIEAIVSGYETAIRVGEAVTPSHYYFWHTTGTCGAFGACAAAGKLLRLDQDQMVWAIGNAGTQAAGLWEFISDGAMSKHLHAGKAAYNGLLAALLAKEGFTGAKAIIDGERGFCRAMAPTFDLSKITDRLGKPPYKIEENSFKIHASCRHTHPAIDLILDLAARNNIRAGEVACLSVKTYRTALDITSNPEPRSVYAAKFSLPFCAALAFVRGSCGLEDFSEECLWDSEIRRLAGRVRLEVDEEIESHYPARWGARVEIVTGAGKCYSARADFPKGDPENPLDDEQLISKFCRLAGHTWSKKKVETLLRAALDLEGLEDAASLFN
ncbi:MAG: MmgE/PrpD family protein [Syntrophobacteraceae bacterium]|jgi:2-methylcitrate dehydratase PrpD